MSLKIHEPIFGKDYLVGGVLYCSLECVKEDGHRPSEANELPRNSYSQEKYGACCPVCDGEYAAFIQGD